MTDTAGDDDVRDDEAHAAAEHARAIEVRRAAERAELAGIRSALLRIMGAMTFTVGATAAHIAYTVTTTDRSAAVAAGISAVVFAALMPRRSWRMTISAFVFGELFGALTGRFDLPFATIVGPTMMGWVAWSAWAMRPRPPADDLPDR